MFRVNPENPQEIQVRVAGVWFVLGEAEYGADEVVNDLNRVSKNVY